MNFVLRIAGSLALLLSAAGTAASEEPTLKIGSILILTGESAHYGTEAQNGARIAIDEINLGGGIGGKKLEFIWEDETGGRAERAVMAYKKLTSSDGVRFIFGPSFQDALEAIAPMAKRDEIFLVTPSTPSLSLPNVFSTWIDPEIESKALADHLFKRFKRVAILGEQQSWVSMVSKQFASRFTELGGTITVHEQPLTQAADLKTEVLRVKESKPEAVFIPSYALFGRYAKALRQQRVELPIFGIEADSSLIQAGGEAAEGAVSIGPSVPESAFNKKYLDRYKRAPDMPAFQAYDAVMLLSQALRQNGTTVAGVRSFFAGFERFEGVSGTITNRNGIVRTSMALFAARGGILHKIQDVHPSE